MAVYLQCKLGTTFVVNTAVPRHLRSHKASEYEFVRLPTVNIDYMNPAADAGHICHVYMLSSVKALGYTGLGVIDVLRRESAIC